MDPLTVVEQYFSEVYERRDSAAAGRFIADPCLRHEHGELIEMSLADNVARIDAFLDRASDLTYDNPVMAGSADFATVCFNLHFGGGTLSGIEVFRVIDDRIVETWNSTVQPNRWG